MKIAFVILNYNTKQECISCIESIINLEKAEQQVEIIVVDNGSKEDITSISVHYDFVHFIQSEYNLGFAKGNNLGYQYAKHCLNAQCIVILNSDVIIEQPTFLQTLVSEYRLNKCDIIGPDIVTMQLHHQNPATNVLKELHEVRKAIVINRLRYLKTYLPISVKLRRISEPNWQEECEDIPIHGACIIFMEDFIKKHEHAFYPATFLYGEEEFLYYIAKKNGEKIRYIPNIQVRHQEDAAINNLLGNGREKKRYVIKQSLKSLQLLSTYMIQDNQN